jgi:hypothetical protein
MSSGAWRNFTRTLGQEWPISIAVSGRHARGTALPFVALISRTVAISGSRKRLSKNDRLVRESAALRCSGRGPPRGRRSTSRRTGFYRGQGVARQRGSPANRGSAHKRRAQRGYTPRSGTRIAASSASTLLQPSRPHRAGHPLRHTPIDAAPPPSPPETRHRLRSPDWATMRPSFALRRFT